MYKVIEFLYEQNRDRPRLFQNRDRPRFIFLAMSVKSVAK